MPDDMLFADAERSAAKHKEYALLSQVAHMYYDLDMLQPEIAAKLFFSRSKVSRMLTQAKQLGIVEIKVRRIVDRVPSMEKKLRDTFGLKEAVVISSFESQSDAELIQTLTDFAALYVSGLLKGRCKVGISDGRTINEVVKKLRKVTPCNLEVVQLIGSTSNTFLAVESRHMVDEMLSIFSGKGYFLNTPIYIDDVYAKEVLLKDPTVREVFDHMRSCGLLLTRVGALNDPERGVRQWYGYQTREHMEELREKGAVGSVCAQYYDIDGKLVPSEWNDKCIAMPLEDVRKNEQTIGIAAGDEKARPILGALRGRLLNVLVTDAATATLVMQMHEESDDSVNSSRR